MKRHVLALAMAALVLLPHTALAAEAERGVVASTIYVGIYEEGFIVSIAYGVAAPDQQLQDALVADVLDAETLRGDAEDTAERVGANPLDVIVGDLEVFDGGYTERIVTWPVLDGDQLMDALTGQEDAIVLSFHVNEAEFGYVLSGGLRSLADALGEDAAEIEAAGLDVAVDFVIDPVDGHLGVSPGGVRGSDGTVTWSAQADTTTTIVVPYTSPDASGGSEVAGGDDSVAVAPPPEDDVSTAGVDEQPAPAPPPAPAPAPASTPTSSAGTPVWLFVVLGALLTTVVGGGAAVTLSRNGGAGSTPPSGGGPWPPQPGGNWPPQPGAQWPAQPQSAAPNPHRQPQAQAAWPAQQPGAAWPAQQPGAAWPGQPSGPPPGGQWPPAS